MSLHTLPEQTLVKIFSELPLICRYVDIFNVCERFRDVIVIYWPPNNRWRVTEEDMSDICERYGPNRFEHVMLSLQNVARIAGAIDYLTDNWPYFTPSQFNEFCFQMKVLTIRNVESLESVKSDNWKELKKLTVVNPISILKAPIWRQVAHTLSLSLTGLSITLLDSQCIMHIRGLLVLQILDLNIQIKFRGNSLKFASKQKRWLSGMPSLKHLSLRGRGEDWLLNNLLHGELLKGLETLSVEGCLNSRLLQRIAHYSKDLEKLKFNASSNSANKLVEILKANFFLQYLYIDGIRLTRNVLEKMRRYFSLRIVSHGYLGDRYKFMVATQKFNNLIINDCVGSTANKGRLVLGGKCSENSDIYRFVSHSINQIFIF